MGFTLLGMSQGRGYIPLKVLASGEALGHPFLRPVPGCPRELRVKDLCLSLGSAPHLLGGFGKALHLSELQFFHPLNGDN